MVHTVIGEPEPTERSAMRNAIMAGAAGVSITVLAHMAAGSGAVEPIENKPSGEIGRSIFGTCLHVSGWWKHEDILPMVEKTGFTWIRDSVGWAAVEKQKGVLQIPDEDMAWIDDACARGFNICMPLVYFNPLYGHKDWPALCEAYARYCVFTIGELKDKVQVWEIWNEPALFFRLRTSFGGSWNATEGSETPWLQRFTEMLIAAAQAIRAEHPEVTIVAGDIILPVNYHLLDLLKERDALDLLDGIVLHPYTHRVTPETMPWGGPRMNERDGVVVIDDDHSYASVVRRTREKMKAVGMKTTDIYVTESGFATQPHSREQADAQNMGHNLETQAKYLARMFLLHKALDVKVAIQYDFQDDSMKYKLVHPEGNFGLVMGEEHGYRPKPSWHVMRRLCSLLADPMRVWTPDWTVTVDPPGYINNRKWPYTPGVTTWDGSPIKALDRVLTHLFRNDETSDVLLAAWNAIEPGPRSHLLATIALGTDAYSEFEGIDLMTGRRFDVKVVKTAGMTKLEDVIIPDYPIVIRMKQEQEP
jgi:hypothetical protein